MQRASFFVALGQLLVGLLLYFHIEPTWIGNNIQWTRDNWILFFLFGGLAFTGFGLYRTFRPRVNVRNIERKIVEWLQAVRLGYDEHHFQPWHFTYVVIFRGLRTFIGRPRALSGRYLQVEARITPAPGELAQRLEKLNQRDQNDFYKALALEAAKARIYYNWNSANDLSIIKWLPITNQLSDASILDSLTEIYLSAVVIWNTVGFWLDATRELKTQQRLTDQAESPAQPQARPDAKEEKHEQT